MSVLEIGDRIDRFVVEDVLGEGGIARVYKVRHRQLGTVHALKLMAVKSEALTQRLVREGRIQANLSHPGVVAVTDIIEHGGFTGLLMEVVEGRSLDIVLGETGPPPLPEALALFRQVLAGVAAAHEAGVLHRDLKPGNILLEPQGDGVVAKVTDFGIAKVALSLGESQTQQSDLMGTPGYMAPEQADDPSSVDARADIYSLGAVLYCLVTGRPPFAPASLPSLLAAARAGSFARVGAIAPDVPEGVARVVERCLAPDPADRYPDCRALAQALYGADGAGFDEEVAGARPVVLHVRGAVPADPPAAPPASARTAVPATRTWAPEAGAPEPLDDPGPLGKYLFFGSAAFVLAALGWLMFQTWSKTGSVVLDPERARAAVDAQAPPPTPASGAPLPAPSPATPAAPEEGAVDPGLDGPGGPVAPLGALDEGRAGVAAGSNREGAGAPVGGDPPEDRRAAEPSPPDEPVADPSAGVSGAAEDAGEDRSVAAGDAASLGGSGREAGASAVDEGDAGPGDGAEAAPGSGPAGAEEPAPAVDLRGTWTGKLGGRPLTLRIMDAAGGAVSAEIDVLVGTTYRTFEVRGPASGGGTRLSLAQPAGDGWRLEGAVGDGGIEGTILPPGRKRGQPFSVRRE